MGASIWLNAVWSDSESSFVYLLNDKQNDAVTEEQSINVFDENYMTHRGNGATGDNAIITGDTIEQVLVLL